ncbi:hypothetical protein [Massilia endophytica]|nr:hypothetical protein [Massilia endophytica]UGQ48492.1 hypothetical protein LSQ66_08510 [Massilia endophytica]
MAKHNAQQGSIGIRIHRIQTWRQPAWRRRAASTVPLVLAIVIALLLLLG